MTDKILLNSAISPKSANGYSYNYYNTSIVPCVNFTNGHLMLTLPVDYIIEINRSVCEQVSYLRDSLGWTRKFTSGLSSCFINMHLAITWQGGFLKKKKKKIMIPGAGILLQQMNTFQEFRSKENHKLPRTMQSYLSSFLFNNFPTNFSSSLCSLSRKKKLIKVAG